MFKIPRKKNNENFVDAPGIPVLIKRKKRKQGGEIFRKVRSLKELLLARDKRKVKEALIRNMVNLTHKSVNGTNLLEEDWDYLFILDACRYDFFKGFYDLGFLSRGKLEKIYSVGRQTAEWAVNTFNVEKRYEDIIYVSANPYIAAVCMETGLQFYQRKKIWKNRWDEAWQTIKPKVVNEEFLTTEEMFPDKRFIVHYIQPHRPYLLYGGPHGALGKVVRSSKMTQKKLIRGYIYNLYRVLKAVEELLPDLSGEIVISSDHGELLGEWGFYEHKASVNHRKLYEIPLLRIEQ